MPLVAVEFTIHRAALHKGLVYTEREISEQHGRDVHATCKCAAKFFLFRVFRDHKNRGHCIPLCVALRISTHLLFRVPFVADTREIA